MHLACAVARASAAQALAWYLPSARPGTRTSSCLSHTKNFQPEAQMGHATEDICPAAPCAPPARCLGWRREGSSGREAFLRLGNLTASPGPAVQATRAEGSVSQARARQSREDKHSPDSTLTPGWGVQVWSQGGAVLGPQRCSRGPKPHHFPSYIFTGCQK